MTITTGQIGAKFGDLIDSQEQEIEDFIKEHTGKIDSNGNFVQADDGQLILSSTDSLELQKLMGEQSIVATSASNTLKKISDSILTAARNI